jgi:hypothetical protein
VLKRELVSEMMSELMSELALATCELLWVSVSSDFFP